MFSLISSALTALIMLMLFTTPVGGCLLLASPFWAMGMEIVFHFVDNQYPDKIIAIVSAIVGLLFVAIIRFIWVYLLLQGRPTQGDEAVPTTCRVVSAAAGKYGGQCNDEAPGANDLAAVISCSSSSVGGFGSNQGRCEYDALVGGSCGPNLVLTETGVPSADLSFNEPCMPEVGDVAYCFMHAKNLEFASICRSPVLLPVGNELVSLPSVSHSTGLSGGTFVASAANVTDMKRGVDAFVGGSGVAGVVDPTGEAPSVRSVDDISGADSRAAAAFCCGHVARAAITGGSDADHGALGGASVRFMGACSTGDLTSGAASADDAMLNGACFSSAVVSRVNPGEISFGALARSVSCALIISAGFSGVKRLREVDFSVSAGRDEQRLKKRRIFSLSSDGVPLLKATLEARAIAAAIAVNAALAHAGALSGGAVDTIINDPMDVCVPALLPPSPKAMDFDVVSVSGVASVSGLPFGPDVASSSDSDVMDVDADNLVASYSAWEPSDMDTLAEVVISLAASPATTASSATTALPATALLATSLPTAPLPSAALPPPAAVYRSSKSTTTAATIKAESAASVLGDSSVPTTATGNRDIARPGKPSSGTGRPAIRRPVVRRPVFRKTAKKKQQ